MALAHGLPNVLHLEFESTFTSMPAQSSLTDLPSRIGSKSNSLYLFPLLFPTYNVVRDATKSRLADINESKLFNVFTLYSERVVFAEPFSEGLPPSSVTHLHFL
jgi:hypothetical protein